MVNHSEAIVGYALSRRRDVSSRRNLIKGLNRHTEHYAYEQIIPLSGGSRNEEFALRLAGLVSSHDFPQVNDVSLGEFLRMNAKSNGVETEVLRLISLDRYQAIESIQRLLLRTSAAKSGFNWFSLGAVLEFWGNGITDESLKMRQRILKDFYRANMSLEVEVNKESIETND
jgi:hypothetical protein